MRFHMRGLLAVSLLLGLLGLAACSGPGNLPPIPQTSEADYHLGPGDQVRIITFGDEQLTGEFRVKDDGTISMPLLGQVKAAGLSTTQLGNEVTRALVRKDLYKSPSVSVEVTAYRPVFVLGEVARPGQYPYQPGMTVQTAVAIAGGFTYRAVEDAFKITRSVDDKPTEGRAGPETSVRPGDVIKVYERSF